MTEPGPVSRDPSPSDGEDTELMRRMAQGDADAFAAFYDRHVNLLFGVALKVVDDRREAEEVVQDAARTLWQNAPLYRPALGKPATWAVVITRNRAIDRLRKLQRRNEVLARLKNEDAGVSPAAPGAALVGAENAKLIREALESLPKNQRVAIELAFFGGLSQSEIADELNQPLGTIKARIRRGMMTMRDALEGLL